MDNFNPTFNNSNEQTPSRDDIISKLQETPFADSAEFIKERLQFFIDNPKNAKENFNPVREDPKRFIESLLASQDVVLERVGAYNETLDKIADAFGIPADLPESEKLAQIQESSIASFKEKLDPEKKTINFLMGIGGVGKGTVKDMTGFPSAVNHTTRAKRATETADVDYHFMDQDSQWYKDTVNVGTTEQQMAESFANEYGKKPLVVLKRTVAGADGSESLRGFYILTEDEVTKHDSKVVNAEMGVEQIKELHDTAENIQAAVTVVMPPAGGALEVYMRILARQYGDAQNGSFDENGVYKLNDSFVTSTINPLDELNVAAEFSKEMPVAFVVNDKLNETVDRVKDLFQ
jgi:hypothetical protein